MPVPTLPALGCWATWATWRQIGRQRRGGRPIDGGAEQTSVRVDGRNGRPCLYRRYRLWAVGPPGQHGDRSEGSVEPAARSMAALNKRASELMVELGAHACTDVTGFGLLGHLGNMA